jgi:hypothetical protein
VIRDEGDILILRDTHKVLTALYSCRVSLDLEEIDVTITFKVLCGVFSAIF